MKRYAIPALVFVFPLVYYFRFVFPNSGLLILQNDFGYLYFVYKAYLLDSWAHGHFPYWSPAEACGYGFFGNPFTAVFYPPNLLLLLVRLVTGGYSTWFHQIYTVLGVSTFALGLYAWLHRSFAQPAAAAFAAIAVSTCWMVSEFLRFPNAIHALAWLPWALSALHALHHQRKLRYVFWGVAAIFCQATAGYPYFVVYSLLFYAAYALYLHWSSAWLEWKWRAGHQLATIAIPMLVTLPYTNAVSHLMAATTDRNGGDFTYATEYAYGPLDFIGSLVFPPVVTVEGCFYAGSLAVFLMALYFWRGPDAREKTAVLLGFMAFLSLMFGFRSFLFAPVWSFTPVINQMRVFGRMATMLLPLLAIVLHQGYSVLARQLDLKASERDLVRVVWAAFGVILLVQAYLYVMREPLNAEYARLTVPTLPAKSREIDFLMYTLMTLGLVLAMLRIEWSSLRFGAALSCGALVWIVTQDTGTEGRFLWAQPVQQSFAQLGAPDKGSVAYRVFAARKVEGNFFRLIHDYFELDRIAGSGELTWRGLTRGLIPNWNYQRYADFLHKWGSDSATLDRLLGPKKLFFHTELARSPKSFLTNVRAAGDAADAAVIKEFDGSELLVEITNREPGYLGWIDNWDDGWTAQVDAAPARIELLLGTFKSVRLAKPGKHLVRFRYRPVISPLAYVGLATGIGGLVFLPLWARRRRKPATNVAEAA
jgi:hypothetical protein